MRGKDRRPVYVSGDWEIDLARRELRVGRARVHLGSRAFDIVELLVQSAGELVSKDDLVRRIWQRSAVQENTLHFHISAIRKAFGADRGLLKTVSGRGYCLTGDWVVQDGAEPDASRPVEMLPGRASATPGNLPAAASELIGRSVALQKLRVLIAGARVVTLTGPGGIGKSKLALAAARDQVARFEGQVWWVDLASVSHPDLVPSSVAAALALKLGGDDVSCDAVAGAIGDRTLLVVLDNCEHLVDAVARLADALVTRCPHIVILATSQEALRIEGEQLYGVPPLQAPPPQATGCDKLLAYSAVQLFIARATALDRNAAASDQPLAAIAAICRRLDGMPLAIEFAAARAATLGVGEVAGRLDDRFAVLTSGRRTALPRHQTLRATLDWSYELLPAPEQRVLRGLAVFPAGFTLDAATAVLSDDKTAPAAVADGVASLVAKSLVTFNGSKFAARWRLLETIRAYAQEKLAESGESDRFHHRYAEFVRDFLERSLSGGEPAADEHVLACWAREIDTIRAALDWAFSHRGDAAIGAAITANYAPVWLHLSLMAECRERTEHALQGFDSRSDLDLRIRMRLALALGLSLSYAAGSVERAWTALSEALDIAASLDDTGMQLRALWGMWSYRINRGEHRITRTLAARFSAVARSTGNAQDLLVGERLLGTTLHYEGHQREARDYLERFLDLYVAANNQRHMMWIQLDQRLTARCYLARTLMLLGLSDQGRRHARTALDEAQANGHALLLCFVYSQVTIPIAITMGDLTTAARSIEALTELAAKTGVTFWTSYGPCLRAVLLMQQGAVAEGTALMFEALENFRRSGNMVYYLPLLGIFAEGLAGAGRIPEARAANDEALAASKRDGQGWYLPELLRINGELLLRDRDTPSSSGAERCFLESITLAQRQGALLWELRAALSLARLHLSRHRPGNARQVLARTYGQFTEGFDAADVRAARAMLDALGAPSPRPSIDTVRGRRGQPSAGRGARSGKLTRTH